MDYRLYISGSDRERKEQGLTIMVFKCLGLGPGVRKNNPCSGCGTPEPEPHVHIYWEDGTLASVCSEGCAINSVQSHQKETS